ncbi:hypothetical protein DPMN_096801 [Dreissena polymorpha]|uniref:Uncharacterized protein n=1 Tax=Dreissena polymorpha TaxID=45954 RepID=A0A9D4R4T9_DREPO|nr:hypothetical protein DPMN_096801 [Dreissena polymorpha]
MGPWPHSIRSENVPCHLLFIGCGVRKKPPPEETPFGKNGRAEETPFHSLHTRKKPPR